MKLGTANAHHAEEADEHPDDRHDADDETAGTETLAAGLLVAYYLLSIEIYLATYTVGVFQISLGPIGGTELRLLLGGLNLLALRVPRVSALGFDAGLFDLAALVAIPGLMGAVLVQGVRHGRHLARLERLDAC